MTVSAAPAHTPVLTRILTKVVPFVEQRRKSGGGFGATRRLPATIDDTYFALRILDLCRQHQAAGLTIAPERDQALQRYLDGAGLAWHLGISTRCHLLAARRLANLPVETSIVLGATLPLLTPDAPLTTWFYGLVIIRDILGVDPATVIDAGMVRPLLAQPWRTIDEVRAQLFVRKALRVPLAPAAAATTGHWLMECQSGDGGFGFMPGTTSFVENCRYGLDALAELGAAPPDREALFAFLCGCQSASGGFSRKGHATAFLDATWHAVSALTTAAEL